MSSEQIKVLFLPSGKRGEFPKHTQLLDAARTLGVDIDSVCGGRGLCGRCQIACMSGHFQKHNMTSSSEHLSPLVGTEIKFNERKGPLPEGRRLSCHAELLDDVIIDVPPESQVHRQIIRKDAEHRDIQLSTATRLYFVTLVDSSLDDARGEARLLFDALEADWGLTDLGIETSELVKLQSVLASGDRGVTVAVFESSQIVGVWSGLFDAARGVAVDVGSTTVAAHLCDLATGDVLSSASVMNPQIPFGEDLMSRVSYIMMHPEGAEAMTAAIQSALSKLFVELTDQLGETTDNILEISLVANPIMHHLVLGINPINLGGAPFALTLDEAVTLKASDLGLNTHLQARLFVLPCIAGHVGADTAGVILAEAPDREKAMSLIVDVGTNAEIVLGNEDRLLVCSSPTGPAFEGGEISAGQRATAGAIERVRIDRETLEPRFKVIGSDLWSTEPGFESSTKGLNITGICGSGIIEVIAEMFLAGIITQDGIVDGALAEQTERVRSNGRTWSYVLHFSQHESQRDIVVTQNDVRQIQLAKAALYAGIKLLMDKMGVATVDRIRLAGAFGSHISVEHAMVLGLIPDCALSNVSSAGNAAGVGARIALLNRESRVSIQQTVNKAERIETATEADFQDYFVAAMAFPHKSDPYPNLFSVVPAPPLKTAPEPEGRRRRRR
ncbi:MAG: ASKHA domain-containing protein [Luminiphilus sp.]